jgi:hypothetical protein
MPIVIECTEGHYEVQQTSYGECYVWCHEHVVVECDCGERPVLSASKTVCGCGVDHASLVREELSSKRSSEECNYSWWEAEYREWRKKRDEFLRSEYNYWLELNAVDSAEG